MLTTANYFFFFFQLISGLHGEYQFSKYIYFKTTFLVNANDIGMAC